MTKERHGNETRFLMLCVLYRSFVAILGFRGGPCHKVLEVYHFFPHLEGSHQITVVIIIIIIIRDIVAIIKDLPRTIERGGIGQTNNTTITH